MALKQRVACLLANGFEDSEFKIPYERLLDAGIAVDIIGRERGRQLWGKKGKESALVDRTIDEVKPEEYDALFIPGGHSPDELRGDERFIDFVKRFDKLGRPLAAICHGPQLLLSANLVRGRTLTAWKTVQGDLKCAGAVVKDEPLVRDGHWITSRKPDDLPEFTEALLKSLR